MPHIGPQTGLFVLLSLHILCAPRRLAEQTTEIKRMLTSLIQKLNAEG
jgi:hypothetical protein